MSKVTGIIAEFNPFHNGHRYLLSQATGTKVVVMSGNWMQRGEPAYIDKWIRAEMALMNGADLVVELPVLASLQGADFFAKGAVDILSHLSVTEILFGSEVNLDYQEIADIYRKKSEKMQTYLDSLPDYLSYPVKAEKMWAKFANIQFNGGSPNHILGLAYAKAVKESDIQLKTIIRETGYNDDKLAGTIASATAVRQNLPESKKAVPKNIWELLLDAAKVSWSDFWELLRYKIILSRDLTQIYQVNEELSRRIKLAIKVSGSIEMLVEKVYTKRYTKGHIRRLLTYILLDIPKNSQLVQDIHVLGFTEKGQDLLAGIRKKDISLVTRIGKNPWDSLTQSADEIYRLGNSEIPEQTYARKPIIK
ncbi:MAG: nucleotidyltransferase [Lactovum sp.]